MPEFNFDAHYLETVGLECESPFLQKETVQEQINRILQPIFPNKRVVNVTRDASAEIRVEYLRLNSVRHVYMSSHTKAANIVVGMGRDPRTMGYEFYTSPVSIEDMERLIYPTMFSLVNMGDSVSDRAASHIHVGFAHNLRLLKRLLRICLAIDPILFRLGGMGGLFRGWKNHAAYARPLMNSVAVKISKEPSVNSSGGIRVPIGMDFERDSNGTPTGRMIRRTPQSFSVESQEGRITENSSRYVRIINPMKALEAQNADEFWACFGISSANLTKYHPSRYTAINFYAIMAHGTIEFRHPNASLDPQLLLALIKFLRATVEVSTVCSKEEILSFELLPSNQEVSVGDAMEVITRIINICRKCNVENLPTPNEMDILLSTLELSSFIPLPEIPVLTHIQDFILSEKTAKLGNLEYVEEVLQPNHVDIHNISEKEVSLFDSFPEAL